MIKATYTGTIPFAELPPLEAKAVVKMIQLAARNIKRKKSRETVYCMFCGRKLTNKVSKEKKSGLSCRKKKMGKQKSFQYATTFPKKRIKK